MKTKNELSNSKIEVSSVNEHLHQALESITASWENTISTEEQIAAEDDDENQKFCDLFSDAPSCIGILVGSHHQYKMANPIYLKLIDKKNIINRSVKETMPQVVTRGYLNILDQVYKTGKTFSANEMLIKLKTPESDELIEHYLNFLYQAHRNDKGKIDGILFFANDVTELVTSRKKNEKNEIKLNEAQSLGRIGSFEMNLKTQKVSWSKEQFNQLGFNNNEVCPSTELFMSFIHPDDIESVNKSFLNTFEALKDSSNEYRILLPNGSVRYMYTKWRFEFDKNKTPIRLYGITQDITERKLSEIEIRTLNESLEIKVRERTLELVEANLELDTFNHSVSHDLQIPLVAIGLFAQVMEENYNNQLDSEGKGYLQSIQNGTAEMGQLIRDLLNFSKLNKTEMIKKEVNMYKLVKGVIEELKTSLGKLEYEIILAKIPNAICDCSLVRQVWVNLISNGIKYSSKKKNPVIEIGATEENGILTYFVKDNGIGFNMKFADKIFGIFERLHISSEFEGTGIGLSNVQRIVNRHGGRVWANAKEGKGVTFYFTLMGEKINAPIQL